MAKSRTIFPTTQINGTAAMVRTPTSNVLRRNTRMARTAAIKALMLSAPLLTSDTEILCTPTCSASPSSKLGMLIASKNPLHAQLDIDCNHEPTLASNPPGSGTDTANKEHIATILVQLDPPNAPSDQARITTIAANCTTKGEYQKIPIAINPIPIQRNHSLTRARRKLAGRYPPVQTRNQIPRAVDNGKKRKAG